METDQCEREREKGNGTQKKGFSLHLIDHGTVVPQLLIETTSISSACLFLLQAHVTFSVGTTLLLLKLISRIKPLFLTIDNPSLLLPRSLVILNSSSPFTQNRGTISALSI